MWRRILRVESRLRPDPPNDLEDKATTLKVIERRLRLQNRAVLERSYEFERVFMRRDLSLQYDVIDNALAETKRLLGANAKRPDYTVDDVIDKSFVAVVR